MEDIKIIYSTYEEIVLINYFTSNILKQNNENGKFNIDNDILIIKWNNNVEEKFMKIDKISDEELSSYQIINNDAYEITEELYVSTKKLYETPKKLYEDIYINIFMENKDCQFSMYNDKIININDKDIFFNYKIIDEKTINIKINNYQKVFELNNDNIYIDITEIYDENINVTHEKWDDICVINKYTNFLYRINNNDEYGNFEINHDQLIIYWEKWDSELFIIKDNIYYYKNNIKSQNNEIMLYHINWNDICIIDFKNIFRKSENEEYGTYKINKDQLIVHWEKWDFELFYEFDNNYYYESFIKFLNYQNKNYIINTYINKLYKTNENEYCNIIFEDDNKIIIEWNNIKDSFFYKYDGNNIIMYKDIIRDLIIVKKYDEETSINILTYEINIKNSLKNGIFTLDNNKLKIYWNNLSIYENYILINNKYYYEEYLKLNDKETLLINNNSIIKYNINYFYNYLYTNTLDTNTLDTNTLKIHFLENNNMYYIIIDNILEIYNLKIFNDNTNILILNEIYNKIFKNSTIEDSFNYNIYREFNKDLFNLNDIDLYLHWIRVGFDKGLIYSIQTFLNKNIFFDINGYRINNNLEFSNDDEVILHFINNNRLSIYFYSTNNIEIIYDNSKKIEENIIFIINLEYDYNVDDIFSYIPKNSIIIVNINIEKIKLDVNFENNIINNFANVIITKSHNLINYYVLEFIFKNILKNKNLHSNKIMYINNYYDNFYETIINIPTYTSNNVILFNDEINEYNDYNDYNYLFDIFKTSINKIDIIKILIFYCIIKKNIYNLGDKNFLIPFTLLEKIIDNNFSKELILLL